MRYVELLDMQRRGLISALQRQVKYEIIPAIKVVKEVALKTKTKLVERTDEKAAHYTCDFQYYDRDGVLVIEDAKSQATRQEKDYVLRRKLMKNLIQEQNEVAGREVMRFNEWVSTR